ncbi:peroxisome biogenesis factor 10 [Acarospora aff. strigata]|nr:peroxisome biogenesis factor 10 [Acarospora aff. strigata]
MGNTTDHVHHLPRPTSLDSDITNYNYPFAAAPDIIRSNQKDSYFQGVLFEQLSTILRNLYGARFVHTHTSEARTFTELLYLGLTTLIGNRTLGEEYCDIVQIEDDTLRLPSIYRRAGYILSSVLLPYGLTRLLPAFRHRLRQKLESSLRRNAKKPKSISSRTQSYILDHIDTLTSPSPVYALSLATFYFSGAYYHLGKRLFGLRYIFTRRIPPSEQRIGYEVLGVLLVLQLAVQGWLHLHQTLQSGPSPPMTANAGSAAGGSAVLDGGVEVSLNPDVYTSENVLLFESTTASHHHPGVSRIEKATHTPTFSQPRYHLKDAGTMQWIQGRQQRKCTLCLEEMRDPSVTTCGHVFCWTCIGDWVKEKPECPLCRQVVLGQHVLPLRG